MSKEFEEKRKNIKFEGLKKGQNSVVWESPAQRFLIESQRLGGGPSPTPHHKMVSLAGPKQNEMINFR
jgi:hypothetical protein